VILYSLNINNESMSETNLTPDKRWVKMLAEYLSSYHIGLSENPNVLNIGCGNNVKWNYLGVTIYLANLWRAVLGRVSGPSCLSTLSSRPKGRSME